MSETRSKRDVSLAAVSNVVERDFWIDTFKGGFNRCFIPYDYKLKEEEATIESQTVLCRGQLYESLMRLSNRSDVRLHLILLTAFIALLHRLTEADDITVGVPIYKQDIEGDLVNTALALRCSVNEGVTFKELLLGVRQRLLQAAEHQNYPLEVLCYKLDLQQSPGYFPLFDTALLLENIHDPGYLSHLPLNTILSFQHAEGGYSIIAGSMSPPPSPVSSIIFFIFWKKRWMMWMSLSMTWTCCFPKKSMTSSAASTELKLITRLWPPCTRASSTRWSELPANPRYLIPLIPLN